MAISAVICKTFSFEAAHELPNHDGKCARLHGHHYRVDVYVRGLVQPISGESNEGMVMDFGFLSGAWKEHIEDRVDHRLLNDIIEAPTAERVAAWLLREFRAVLSGEGARPFLGNVVKVRVWETPTSWAEVETNGY